MVNVNSFKNKFPKRYFDVNDKADLRIYKEFLENRNWGTTGCPFELEWPGLSIPDMISHKIAVNAVAKV